VLFYKKTDQNYPPILKIEEMLIIYWRNVKSKVNELNARDIFDND